MQGLRNSFGIVVGRCYDTAGARVVANFLGLSAGIALIGGYVLHGVLPFVAVPFATLVLLGAGHLVGRRAGRSIRWDWVDRHAISLLAGWIALYLCWCGLVLFANPYSFALSHGDAVFYSQTLWNLSHGLRPENSFFTTNDTSLAGADPRYVNSYGYVSIFSLHQYWLPMALLTPLYALSPFPPMQIFALQIYVAVFGITGVYWAARQLDFAPRSALALAICYSLLPQLGVQIFFKGYFDTITLAIMPWLFGALFARKWAILAMVALLLALVSYPFASFVVAFGLMVAVFFRAFRAGIAVMAIGIAVAMADTLMFRTAVMPYLGSAAAIPSFLDTYVLSRTIGSLLDPIKINGGYGLALVQGLGFLPLLALRQNGKWNVALLGLWALTGAAFVLMLFRSYGWEFPRNSQLIVPIFMMGLVACRDLSRHCGANQDGTPSSALFAPRSILLAALLACIAFGSPFRTPPLGSHFPWGPNGIVTPSPDTVAWRTTMEQLAKVVPPDQSLAWRAAPEVWAQLGNRRDTWYMGRAPTGVRYFAFVGDPATAQEKEERDGLIAQLQAQPSFRVAYEGNPGKPLLVFENLAATDIPRDERILGWEVVMRALRLTPPLVL